MTQLTDQVAAVFELAAEALLQKWRPQNAEDGPTLWDVGWRFKWSQARCRWAGYTRYSTKVISVSRPLAALRDPNDVMNTLRHEIGHAMLHLGAGHGPEWMALASTVGYRPEACARDIDQETIQQAKPWRIECLGCRRVTYRVKPYRRLDELGRLTRYRCHCGGHLIQLANNSTG